MTSSFCSGGPRGPQRCFHDRGITSAGFSSPLVSPDAPTARKPNWWARGCMKSFLLNAAFLGSQIVWSSGDSSLGTCRQSGGGVPFWKSWRGVLWDPPPQEGCFPFTVGPPHASFSRRPSVLQRLGHGLQRDSEHHQVGAPVPAVGPAAAPQPPADQRRLPRARRGACLLPQPRRADGGPLVLHAE